MISKKILLSLFLLGAIACKSTKPVDSAKDLILEKVESKLPEPRGYINDFADMLTPAQEQDLLSFLSGYEKRTTREVAVVTLDSISPYTDIVEYGKDLGNYWGLGKKDKNNGLLMILDNGERNIGISTGLGTERVLTDSICKEVIDRTIIPEFKEGRFFEGIQRGLEDLMQKWK